MYRSRFLFRPSAPGASGAFLIAFVAALSLASPALAAKPTDMSVVIIGAKMPERHNKRQAVQRGLSFCYKNCGKDSTGKYRKGLKVDGSAGFAAEGAMMFKTGRPVLVGRISKKPASYNGETYGVQDKDWKTTYMSRRFGYTVGGHKTFQCGVALEGDRGVVCHGSVLMEVKRIEHDKLTKSGLTSTKVPSPTLFTEVARVDDHFVAALAEGRDGKSRSLSLFLWDIKSGKTLTVPLAKGVGLKPLLAVSPTGKVVVTYQRFNGKLVESSTMEIEPKRSLKRQSLSVVWHGLHKRVTKHDWFARDMFVDSKNRIVLALTQQRPRKGAIPEHSRLLLIQIDSARKTSVGRMTEEVAPERWSRYKGMGIERLEMAALVLPASTKYKNVEVLLAERPDDGGYLLLTRFIGGGFKYLVEKARPGRPARHEVHMSDNPIILAFDTVSLKNYAWDFLPTGGKKGHKKLSKGELGRRYTLTEFHVQKGPGKLIHYRVVERPKFGTGSVHGTHLLEGVLGTYGGWNKPKAEAKPKAPKLLTVAEAKKYVDRFDRTGKRLCKCAATDERCLGNNLAALKRLERLLSAPAVSGAGMDAQIKRAKAIGKQVAKCMEKR